MAHKITYDWRDSCDRKRNRSGSIHSSRSKRIRESYRDVTELAGCQRCPGAGVGPGKRSDVEDVSKERAARNGNVGD